MSSSGKFKLRSDFKPTGDQPEAIERLVQGLKSGERFQILEGVTGSGKTFTMSNVIAANQLPTLVISHNKTLAAQLYAEFKQFFSENAVEYFVSYYDYYQPEAYIPQTDTFIEKDASINEEIERLRLAATDSLMNRKDVIIVASVSCIYGLGSPEDYRNMLVDLKVGDSYDRDQMLEDLVNIQYARNDFDKGPGTFSVRGDTVDVCPSYARHGVRIGFFGDEIEFIRRIEVLTGEVEAEMEEVCISPAKHFVLPYEKIENAIEAIKAELEERVAEFESQQKLLEAQRIRMRTEYDIEMLKEMGYCSGIENYARHLAGRKPGSRPATLLDFFPEDFLTIIDESHVTIPQVRGMYNGDQARKRTLVEHGFRLPSALDNRPLNFEEFRKTVHDVIFTSATPGPYEREVSAEPVPQVIRPTGILDPPVEVRPLASQIDDLMEEVKKRAELKERTLVTTLTKKTAEDLAEYLEQSGLRVKYLHSEIDAIERVEILRSLRRADFDCLVGINLLREGLDLPEVSLVAILDADKEGFLRSETSLIQTAGRAARHTNGRVIMYAENITDSMRKMIDVTNARREKQIAYNEEHGITPTSIKKSIQEGLALAQVASETEEWVIKESGSDYNVAQVIADIEKEMMEAAEALEFERAAFLRDQLYELKGAQKTKPSKIGAKALGVRYVQTKGRKRRKR